MMECYGTASSISHTKSQDIASDFAIMQKPSFPDSILQAGKGKRNNTVRVCCNWGCAWYLQRKGAQHLTKEKGQDGPSLLCLVGYCQIVSCHRSKSSLELQPSRHTHFHLCYDPNLMIKQFLMHCAWKQAWLLKEKNPLPLRNRVLFMRAADFSEIAEGSHSSTWR